MNRPNTTRAILLAGLAALWAQPLAAGDIAAAGEYEVKAAMVYSITRFVDWPAAKMGEAGQNFAVCVLGDDPFGGDLEKALSGKSVGGRSVVVRRVADAGAAERCHIVILGASERKRLKTVAPGLARANVLVVGDGDKFASAGAALGLVVRDASVQLEVNLPAAQRAGLVVSSKLLRIATLVKDGS